MERESFEDPETANVMNAGFVCVKVDREERPDVDGIYMRAIQALTGQGGWPLTAFLTPDGRPFYGGTYFPPEPRHGMPSFRQVLAATRAAWDDRREEVVAAAGQVGELLRRSTVGPADEGEPTSGRPPDRRFVEEAVGELLRRFDPGFGGFGRAPKFPQPVVLELLLEHWAFTGSAAPREAALHTLRRMARGGIRDHLGGGFHRYSVDQRWLVPHFEKMLYDNALLAGVYMRAYLASGDEEHLETCRAVLEDLIEDFRSPEGGFFAARDADSEGEEGRFYVWTPDEVDSVLGPEDGEIFRRAYDVSRGGNFEGRNILHLPHDLDAIARENGVSRRALDERLAGARTKLKAARATRMHPARDDKILAGWNGLTLRAFAEVGAALGDARFLELAGQGASWLLGALAPDGRLLHQVPAGDGTAAGAGIPAFLDDVAALGNAVLSLHEATLEPQWLEAALALDLEIEDRFRDLETGLLHDTPADGESLLVRPREVMDSPVPSGTALAAELHLRLGRLLGDEERIQSAGTIVQREMEGMRRMPSGFGRLLAVAQRLAHPPTEVAIIGERDDPRTRALLREIHRAFLPGAVVTGGPEGEAPSVGNPLLEGRAMVEGSPTAFVCSGFACRAPCPDPDGLRRELADLTSHRR
jgi:hypothetical protein